MYTLILLFVLELSVSYSGDQWHDKANKQHFLLTLRFSEIEELLRSIIKIVDKRNVHLIFFRVETYQNR